MKVVGGQALYWAIVHLHAEPYAAGVTYVSHEGNYRLAQPSCCVHLIAALFMHRPVHTHILKFSSCKKSPKLQLVLEQMDMAAACHV